MAVKSVERARKLPQAVPNEEHENHSKISVQKICA